MLGSALYLLGVVHFVPPVVVVIGLVLLLFPDKVRRYDQRMTRLIKDRDEYASATRLLGSIFVLLGLGFLFLFMFGLML